ncbi:hypothetical protein PHLCEN_2v798 [Hermanssonia centrifuga]|uniref:Uncharacterized protein n=1 Tax=Hermanssonia centrifuga TaxID=98765 RepID=A0A2R6S4W1_9APHY|nr:hypothetical protein PHLCEN_2v798 [Hermanssonia centrifuga]
MFVSKLIVFFQLLGSLSFVLGLVLGLPVIQVGFNDRTISKVEADMLQIAEHSWELGTACEAEAELASPALSVFRASAFPPPTHLNPAITGNSTAMIDIATNIVETKVPGTLPLTDGDGAVGDPASLGVAVLLANWTRDDLSDDSFSVAAQEQLDYLLTGAPRTEDGAISHRDTQVQLWADFVYMAPPFIAYYGALAGGAVGADLLQQAYDQCRLYRNYLRDPIGLWRHITLGNGTDETHWGTGNAWAAAGMMRVLQTIRHSEQAQAFQSQQEDLTNWIHEIVSAAWQFQQANGTLLNTIDASPWDSFADSSSTALLAATTYRLATITFDFSLIEFANKAMDVIRRSVDDDGWLQNTVDPETFNTPSLPGEHSPEGQAFVLLLHSAWRDLAEWMVGALPP